MSAAITLPATPAAMIENMEGSSFVEPSKDRHDMPIGREACCQQPVYNKLPVVTSTDNGSETVCPWCRFSMEEATVKVGALNAAWQDFETDWPKRTDTGEAACELVAECPDCHRPSMLPLGSREANLGYGEYRERRYVRLVPVRTAADAAYLARRPA